MMILRFQPFGRLASASAILCCCFVLVGCGKKSEEPNARSQIVAHVGSETITTQELENEFRSANVPVDKQKDPEIIKHVLGDLATRKYLVQQAIAAKLDREPGVLLDILRARELVLQNAYVTRAAASKSPGTTEVDKLIAENPEKFANRKILNVEQVIFPLGPSARSIVEAARDIKSLDEIERQLTEVRTPHIRQMGTLNSSDLPKDFFAAIEANKDQDVFFIRGGSNGIFFKVKSEDPSPVQGEAAANLARQLIKADAIKAEIGIAAYSANIEARYEGSYAKIMQSN